MMPLFIFLCEFTVLEPSETLLGLKATSVSVTTSKTRSNYTRHIGQLSSQHVELEVRL